MPALGVPVPARRWFSRAILAATVVAICGTGDAASAPPSPDTAPVVCLSSRVAIEAQLAAIGKDLARLGRHVAADHVAFPVAPHRPELGGLRVLVGERGDDAEGSDSRVGEGEDEIPGATSRIAS